LPAPRVLLWKSVLPVLRGPTKTTSRPVWFLAGMFKMSPSTYSSIDAGREQGYFDDTAIIIILSISPPVCTRPSISNSANPAKTHFLEKKPSEACDPLDGQLLAVVSCKRCKPLPLDDIVLPNPPELLVPWKVIECSSCPEEPAACPRVEKSDHNSGKLWPMFLCQSLFRGAGNALRPDGSVCKP